MLMLRGAEWFWYPSSSITRRPLQSVLGQGPPVLAPRGGPPVSMAAAHAPAVVPGRYASLPVDREPGQTRIRRPWARQASESAGQGTFTDGVPGWSGGLDQSRAANRSGLSMGFQLPRPR